MRSNIFILDMKTPKTNRDWEERFDNSWNSGYWEDSSGETIIASKVKEFFRQELAQQKKKWNKSSTEDILKEFRKDFTAKDNLPYGFADFEDYYKSIESFLRSALENVREEERERIMQELKTLRKQNTDVFFKTVDYKNFAGDVLRWLKKKRAKLSPEKGEK